jgi:sugar O-acyltransferase (sialic acid O-acetyltransferase NeuD family)
MLIAGAKGFAKQILDVLFQLGLEKETAFFDDYDPDLLNLYEFEVLKSEEMARRYFDRNGNSFGIGVGNPKTRYFMKNKLEAVGGNLVSLISPLARIAREAQIGKGASILTGAVVENDARLGEGVLLNVNATVCHDCQIGNYVEISPGAIITGGCKIGDFSFIGAGAVVTPQVSIGANVVIGAGAVVTRNVEKNVLAVGVPAEVIKQREPLKTNT